MCVRHTTPLPENDVLRLLFSYHVCMHGLLAFSFGHHVYLHELLAF